MTEYYVEMTNTSEWQVGYGQSFWSIEPTQLVSNVIASESVSWSKTLFPKGYADNCLAAWYSCITGTANVWNTLWNRAFSQSVTVDEIIDLSHADHTSHYMVWQTFTCKPEPPPDPETVLELEVVKQFKTLTEVQSIYTDRYLDRKQFLVFTSNERYDDLLMDRLLLIERGLRLSHRKLPASYVYIPRLYQSPREIVPHESKLIYERDWNVILTRPFEASQTQREPSYSTA